jgi:cytochrome P450
MADLNREFTKMRLAHLANLMEQITHDIRPTLERALCQCDNLDSAAEVLREQIAELDDLDEVEKLAGGPVRRVA